MFYFENNIDIQRAAELMQLAINENPNHLGMLYRQALILERTGDIDQAIEAAEKSLKLAQSAGEELKEEYINLNTTLLKRLRK
ncbi:MAG: tetratricopeptide repeat protein [Saprospiraceae bacterium]|nr:tetratricopeptide repeat protein [Saprospiraceae bacterium]